MLAFVHVQSRRVVLSPATYKPDAEWVAAQAEAFVDKARDEGLPVAKLIRDRDGAFSTAFDQMLRRRRVKIVKTQFRAPNMSAFAERFVQSIQHECLDHFVVFGTAHLNYLCREYLDHYHTERPHQGRDNELLVRASPTKKAVTKDDLPTLGEIRCQPQLGGLLKSYSRKAA